MIPREYWRQMRQELNALDWVAIDAAEREQRKRERAHIAKAYDEAIERRRKAKDRERNSRYNALRKASKSNDK